MGQRLKERLRQTRFESATHEAILAILVASADLRRPLDHACEAHGITAGQYNVLRILRGRPEGYPRCEILARLIDRAPDVTRLIDRLEKQGLVERMRGTEDRRHSITRITPRGMDLLDRIRPAMDAVHRRTGRRISASDAREIARLCDQLIEADPEDA